MVSFGNCTAHGLCVRCNVQIQEFVNMMYLKPLVQRIFFAAAATTVMLIAGCGNQYDPAAPLEIINVASPAAPGSMAPHLAVTADGEAIMSWLEPVGEDAHAVKYSILHDNAWSEPKSIAEDNGWFVNWADFPSVVPITAQQWAAHWLVKQPGGTYSYNIALSTSANGGISWAKPLTPHTDNTPTEHGFVSLFPWSNDIGAVWLDGRNMKPDTAGSPSPVENKKYGGMTLRYARFSFNGETLEDGEIDNLVCDCCQTDVALAAAGPVVVYRDRTTGEIRDISVARYVDGGWAEPITVSDDAWKIAGCPVNGPAIEANGNNIIVAWYGAPKRKSRVKIAWSQDGGQTFAAPVIVDEARAKGRVDVTFLPDGSAMVSWVAQPTKETAELHMRRITTAGELGPIQLITAGKYSRNAGLPQMIRAGNRLIYAWPEPGEPRQVLTAFSSLDGG